MTESSEHPAVPSLVHYFAYGSNLDADQMLSRCPSSAFVHRAVLPDHALAFTRFSPKRGCGVADVVPERGAHVWGVVYTLDEEDGRRLDAAEGFVPGRPRNGYERRTCTLYVEGRETDQIEAMTYVVARPATEHQPPNAAYMRHLARGAARWALPEAYQVKLRAIADRSEGTAVTKPRPGSGRRP